MTTLLILCACIAAASATLGAIAEYCWHSIFHGGHHHQ